MSHVNYDFLSESILFGKDLENNFLSTDENVLKKELGKYREHVLANKDDIVSEVLSSDKKVSVTIESFGNYPDDELLKQLALYIDCVFIADPVFELTPERRKMDDVMTQYMGMKEKDTLDKDKLAEALRYMKKITRLVTCNFVKFVPITLLHEVSEYIPIRFDKDNFENCLPSEIMNFLRKHIKVHNLEPCESGLRILSEEPLKKGTGLYIYFPDCKERSGEIVQYMNMETTTICDKSGKMKFALKIPTTISDMEFNIWLNQSINTASKQLYDETYRELCFAQELHSMLNSINKEISSLKRSLGMDAVILTGTLLSSYVTGGMALTSAAALTIESIKGMRDSNKLFGDVRQNPGYFLWKIEKQKLKKWGF